MYIVISRWKPVGTTDEQFASVSGRVRSQLRGQPGVQLVEAYVHGSEQVVVSVYRDKEVFDRIVVETDSPFNYIVRQNGFDKIAELVSVEGGESIPLD